MNDIDWSNNWQDEIKSKRVAEVVTSRINNYTDNELFKATLIYNLQKSEDYDEFEKGFGKDLQGRFPNGSWKTINGARVFVNGGKVVAGLDGFNKEIDKFFEEKKAKKGGKKGGVVKDKNGHEVYEGNVNFNGLSESDKRAAYDNGIKSGEVTGSFNDFKKYFKNEEISEKLIQKQETKKDNKPSDTDKKSINNKLSQEIKNKLINKYINSSNRHDSELKKLDDIDFIGQLWRLKTGRFETTGVSKKDVLVNLKAHNEDLINFINSVDDVKSLREEFMKKVNQNKSKKETLAEQIYREGKKRIQEHKQRKLMSESDALGALKYLRKLDGVIAYKRRDKETGKFYLEVEKDPDYEG